MVKLIRIKLLKDWGAHSASDVLDFGESKGQKVIADGVGVEVSKNEPIIANPTTKKKKIK